MILNYCLSVVLFVLLMVDIFGVTKNMLKIHAVAKFFILPVIFLIYYFNVKKVDYIIFCALFFGWIGDIFMLKKKSGMVYFAIGMFAFLFGHIFYSIKFWTIFQKSPQNLFFLIPYVIIFLLIWVFIIRKSKKPLNYGAFIYFPIILVMTYFSTLCYRNLTCFNFLLLFSGAHLFLISDITLSIRQSFKVIEKNSPLIMLTYVPAQLLIILSFVI